ncbi:MAG: hypothetical protein A3K19_01990 [Lentisphaerae bacterium RIFOXYB12_FULL_65_16]|nr:MAG: hypothetical protein A3K18_29405 [Lentisphaerae bacterium RIFOXYA12_64_32]OGV92649.1 MAG: hypothetical protein A3K19_01990 [Lentisphaerae bacterium RIFOXYB12_FULL_65_16]
MADLRSSESERNGTAARRQASSGPRSALAAGLFALGACGMACPALAVDVAAAPGKPEPVFILDFEDGFTAAKAAGDPKPTNANLPELVAGVTGKAARFSEGKVLRYLAPGNLSMARGSVSLWVQPPESYLTDAWQYVLSTDVPERAGELPFCLWSVHAHGLRYDVRNRPAMDMCSHLGPSQAWRPGEWHHVVLTWDNTASTSSYADGVLATHNRMSDSRKSFIPIQWNINDAPAFFLGASEVDGRMAWCGPVDEVRFFDRPLTAAEARAEFARVPRFSVRTKLLDPYLYAGAKETCRVAFDNLRDVPVTVHPRYSLDDAAGAQIAAGEIGAVEVKPLERDIVALELTVPQPGTYTVTIAFADADGLAPFADSVMGLARKEAMTGTGKRVLVTEVDATAQAPAAESAPSQVLETSAGKYREAGSKRLDRFAMKFTIAEPHAPHVAVLTWPDDKLRTMEVVYQPLECGTDYQGQTGLFAGREYSLSGKLQEHVITFWPLCKENAFIFMTGETGAPAALQGFKVYRLPEGFAASPVQPFSGSVPARSIGMYHEDPVMPMNYGRLADGRSMSAFPGFQTVTDRMLDYLQSFGQDTLHYPIAWYSGPLYGSDVEPLGGGRAHPYNYPQYLAKRMQARGMTFNGWMHLQQLHSLIPFALTDEARVLDGEETVLNMRTDGHLYYRAWHQRDTAYNPIDPRVQAAVKAVVAEIAERFGGEPAFKGVTMNVVEHSMLAFGSIESGYNDVNLRRFQDETGVRIPVDPKDRDRFTKSARWLLDNAKEDWIAWRCRKIHDYYKDLAAVLRAKRPDLTLGVSMYVYPVNYGQSPRPVDYLTSQRNALDWYREQGIDSALYRNDPEFVFIRHTDDRLRWTRGHRGDLMDVEDLRTASMAPEIVAPLRQLDAVALNMHDVYWECDVGHRQPLKGIKEHGWRVSQLNPNTFQCLERYACGMDALDPRSITKGGFVVGLIGMEPYLARYAQAFRALPAVKFEDIDAATDPVRARQKVVDGKNYFYLQNRLPVPVETTVALKGEGEVTDLVAGAPVTRAGDGFRVTLEPYQLYAYRGANAGPVVTGVEARLPDGFVAGLAANLDEAARKYATLEAAGAPVKDLAPSLKYADQCRSGKRYARLYFLLQESWRGNLERMTSDPSFPAFLNVPPEYLQSVQAVRTLRAVKAGGPVQIDARFDEPAWAGAPEFTALSNFLVVRDAILAKPAAEPVSLRLLYDENNLYVGVHCKDSAPAKIVVKKGQRDASVWEDDDAIEIFLRTPALGAKGHGHFGVNAGGSRTDLLTGNLKWDAEWQAAATVVDDGWVAEIAIPFAALKGATPASGWTLNLARTQRDLPKSAIVATQQEEWKCEVRFARIEFE